MTSLDWKLVSSTLSHEMYLVKRCYNVAAMFVSIKLTSNVVKTLCVSWEVTNLTLIITLINIWMKITRKTTPIRSLILNQINMSSMNSTNCLNPPKQHLHILYLHLNIQSLPDTFDKLKLPITEINDQNIKLDFILLCETFLMDINSNQYNIPYYNLLYKNINNFK